MFFQRYRLKLFLIMLHCSKQDNSVIIQWDSDTTNILGFRVVYRLFGDKTFKQGKNDFFKIDL